MEITKYEKIMIKYLIFILGSFIMGIGIGICNFAQLGVDPMSVLVVGTYQRLHVSFGMMNLLLSFLQVLIGFFLDKKNITLATFIAMVFVSMGIDMFGYFHVSDSLTAMPFNFVWLLSGICIYCFGIAVSELPQCGYTSYDVLIFGLQKHTKLHYHQIRWCVDLTLLVSGFLLGGTVGIGTIMILLLAGKLIEKFYDVLKCKLSLWY